MTSLLVSRTLYLNIEVEDPPMAESAARVAESILQTPRTAHRPFQHPVGRLIIDKKFFFRVPFKFLLKPNGNITNLAYYIPLHRRIYMTYCLCSALHAV
jgi:hypothetical protein